MEHKRLINAVSMASESSQWMTHNEINSMIKHGKKAQALTITNNIDAFS